MTGGSAAGPGLMDGHTGYPTESEHASSNVVVKVLSYWFNLHLTTYSRASSPCPPPPHSSDDRTRLCRRVAVATVTVKKKQTAKPAFQHRTDGMVDRRIFYDSFSRPSWHFLRLFFYDGARPPFDVNRLVISSNVMNRLKRPAAHITSPSHDNTGYTWPICR